MDVQVVSSFVLISFLVFGNTNQDDILLVKITVLPLERFVAVALHLHDMALTDFANSTHML